MSARYQSWELVRNAGWERRQPGALQESDCHDHSHFLTIECDCGETMHIHETQIAHIRTDIGSVCHGCDHLLMFPRGIFAKAFAEMRQQGWIT